MASLEPPPDWSPGAYVWVSFGLTCCYVIKKWANGKLKEPMKLAKETVGWFRGTAERPIRQGGHMDLGTVLWVIAIGVWVNIMWTSQILPPIEAQREAARAERDALQMEAAARIEAKADKLLNGIGVNGGTNSFTAGD